MTMEQKIIELVRQHLPDIQALYIFGTWGTSEEWPDSDLDLAVLLPPATAKKIGSLSMSDLQTALVTAVGKEVDLVNLRLVSTVFRKEIITTGRRISCPDERNADEFEMVTLSLYQKLNEERADILAEAEASGRFLDV